MKKSRYKIQGFYNDKRLFEENNTTEQDFTSGKGYVVDEIQLQITLKTSTDFERLKSIIENIMPCFTSPKITKNKITN